MKNKQKRYSFFISVIVSVILCSCSGMEQKEHTNFIIFLTDDQGYNDLGCYGAPTIKTPNLDEMAMRGIRFTNFYAQPLCGPSRAALLTGSYPIRIAEPNNTKGFHTKLHPKEITIAEVLKKQGYNTACIGKWHAGEEAEQMPLKQGFDYYFGTPEYNGNTKLIEQSKHRSVVLRNNDTLNVINTVKEMGQLTRRYTKEAVNYIKSNKNKPFFLYLSHNMPHVPLGASDDFRGKSKGGLYGDVIEELDWSMGEVLRTLKEEKLEENTLVIFVSDNGPWIEDKIGDHGGSAFPLKGSKAQTWEGGVRVPCIMQWKGKLTEGSINHQLLTTMDFLPSFVELAEIQMPDTIAIDGKSFSDVILHHKESGHERFYYYAYTHLQAIRDKEWKLVLPRKSKPAYMKWRGRRIDGVNELQLFNLVKDKEEQHNVADTYPDKVDELLLMIEEAREELGDYNRIGHGARFYDNAPVTSRINAFYELDVTLNDKN